MSEDARTGAPTQTSTERTRLLSRVLITWAELLAVGFAGAALGGAASGPPQLIVYFATILASVAVVMYNVDQLVVARIQGAT
jgi:hypothetical protein